MVGSYNLADMQPCNLPQQVATGFGEVTQSLVGAEYMPVLYVGEQVVHGLNHMLICLQTLSAKDAPKHLVTMVLNQNRDDGSIVGKWTIVSIEQIV